MNFASKRSGGSGPSATTQLLENLDMAHFVWSTLNHAQDTIAGTGSKGLEILKTILG